MRARGGVACGEEQAGRCWPSLGKDSVASRQGLRCFALQATLEDPDAHLVISQKPVSLPLSRIVVVTTYNTHTQKLRPRLPPQQTHMIAWAPRFLEALGLQRSRWDCALSLLRPQPTLTLPKAQSFAVQRPACSRQRTLWRQSPCVKASLVGLASGPFEYRPCPSPPHSV